jgi:MerR family transcriptional regulator/heat shock protein HspR
MTGRLLTRELVARQLAVSPGLLARYERLGLVHVSQEGQVEGYEPGQVRRLWKILSFQRDLGINLAGVEVILRLCDRMSEVHHRLDDLASELREILEAESGSPAGSVTDESR